MTHLTPEEYNSLFETKDLDGSKDELPPVPTSNGEPVTPEEGDVQNEFAGYGRKFNKEFWQTMDIIHLLRYTDPFPVTDNRDPTTGTANWSEMGCYKTSTGLWYT